MSRHQTLRVSVASGALLLLAGCGSQSRPQEPPVTPSDAAVTSDGAVSATTPRAEGTGPESPLAPGGDEISLSVPTLPIGISADPNPAGEDVCITVRWVGSLHPGNTVTVTSVVVGPPYQDAEPDAACTGTAGPSCARLRFTPADQGGTTCAAAATGKPGRGTGTAPVTVTGALSCPAGQSAVCQQDLSALAATAAQSPAGFPYSLPPETAGPGSPAQTGAGSPAPSDTSAS